MPVEIERTFLVTDDSWRTGEPGVPIRQGYLLRALERTVRVRRVGAVGAITVKGPGLRVRAEFEYPIPAVDADELLDSLCEPGLIEKVRYSVVHGGRRWSIDEFAGRHAGLVLAEVELDEPDEPVDLPTWVGEEVTDDPAYRNAALSAS